MMAASSTSTGARPFWAISGLALSGTLALSACAPDESAEFEDNEVEAAGQTETPESTNEGNNDDESTPSAEDTSEEDPAVSESPEAEGEENSDEDEASEEGAEAEASTGSLDPEDAVETITYDLPSDSSTSLEVGFHELRVIDDVMILELSFTPEYSGITHTLDAVLSTTSSPIVPELNDRQNLKSYSVVSSDNDRWHSRDTTFRTLVESGQTLPYWGYFAAPEDDIDTISVSVIPGAVEFEDMEITWDSEESADPGADESVNGEGGE